MAMAACLAKSRASAVAIFINLVTDFIMIPN
jgi:hypothetical protein